MDTSNNLQEMLQGIEQKAKELGLYIVRGWPSSQWPYLNWQGEWSEYLEVAGLAKTPLLYLQVEPFDLEERNKQLAHSKRGLRIQRMHSSTLLDNEDEELADEDELDDKGEWLFRRLVEQTEGWRSYQQQICYIWCVWFKEGVGHYFGWDADWYSDYGEAARKVLEEASQVEAEDRHVHKKEEAATRLQQAKQLAQHERFTDASNDDRRRYMAAQMFPDLDKYDITLVVSLAQAVYWWEVEPEMHATKAQKARDLRAKGESIENIAAVLGMSAARVKAAIAGG